MNLLKIVLAFAVSFSLLSSVYRSEGYYLTQKQLCPDFGDINLSRVPSYAVIFDRTGNQKKLAVKNQFGEFFYVPERIASRALEIRNKREYDNFISIYKSICGGIPSFKHQIAYLRDEILRRRSETKMLAKIEIPEFGSYKPVDETKSIVKDTSSERGFQVLGKVLFQKGKNLVLYGSSLPNKTATLLVPGFVSNGIILLKNFKPEDIASPPGFESKHVQANNLEYVGLVTGEKIISERIPVYVFRHKSVKSKVATTKNRNMLFAAK
jgi:hypothetical protein